MRLYIYIHNRISSNTLQCSYGTAPQSVLRRTLQQVNGDQHTAQITAVLKYSSFARIRLEGASVGLIAEVRISVKQEKEFIKGYFIKNLNASEL